MRTEGDETPVGDDRGEPGRGDEAFARFYASTYPRVVRLALASSGRIDVAEELAQEAFLSAHRRWSRISAYDDPAAWVCRVVVNRGVSGWRRRAAEARALTRVRAMRTADVALPEDDERVWAEVRRLPRRQAEVLLLIAVEDRSTAQIAELLAIGENSVRTHLKRARATLAGRLGTDEEDPS